MEEDLRRANIDNASYDDIEKKMLSQVMEKFNAVVVAASEEEKYKKKLTIDGKEVEDKEIQDHLNGRQGKVSEFNKLLSDLESEENKIVSEYDRGGDTGSYGRFKKNKVRFNITWK